MHVVKLGTSCDKKSLSFALTHSAPEYFEKLAFKKNEKRNFNSFKTALLKIVPVGTMPSNVSYRQFV